MLKRRALEGQALAERARRRIVDNFSLARMVELTVEELQQAQ
jgi:hypothetical protein